MDVRPFDEPNPPIGVVLSVPLDASTHNDGTAEHDVSQSWSICKSISNVTINEPAETLDFDVEIWNLGALESSSTIVECVLGFIDGIRPVYRKIEGRKFVSIPGATPSGASRVTVRFASIPINGPGDLTHIYVSVHDPLYDPKDPIQTQLLAEQAPVNPNPARVTRKVGCLNVNLLDQTMPFLSFYEETIHGHYHHSIQNWSRYAPDVVLTFASRELGSFRLTDGTGATVVDRFQEYLDTIVNAWLPIHEELAWLGINDGDSTPPNGWSESLRHGAPGAVLVDGQISVNGFSVSGYVVEGEFQVHDPNDENIVLGKANIRILAR